MKLLRNTWALITHWFWRWPARAIASRWFLRVVDGATIVMLLSYSVRYYTSGRGELAAWPVAVAGWVAMAWFYWERLRDAEDAVDGMTRLTYDVLDSSEHLLALYVEEAEQNHPGVRSALGEKAWADIQALKKL